MHDTDLSRRLLNKRIFELRLRGLVRSGYASDPDEDFNWNREKGERRRIEKNREWALDASCRQAAARALGELRDPRAVGPVNQCGETYHMGSYDDQTRLLAGRHYLPAPHPVFVYLREERPNKWSALLVCRRRASNPHAACAARDFKSLVSTNSTTPARTGVGPRLSGYWKNKPVQSYPALRDRVKIGSFRGVIRVSFAPRDGYRAAPLPRPWRE
jgi:hypothetical protein